MLTNFNASERFVCGEGKAEVLRPGEPKFLNLDAERNMAVIQASALLEAKWRTRDG